MGVRGGIVEGESDLTKDNRDFELVVSFESLTIGGVSSLCWCLNSVTGFVRGMGLMQPRCLLP